MAVTEARIGMDVTHRSSVPHQSRDGELCGCELGGEVPLNPALGGLSN